MADIFAVRVNKYCCGRQMVERGGNVVCEKCKRVIRIEDDNVEKVNKAA